MHGHEARIGTSNTPEEIITNQYKRVASSLSRLFEEIAPRTVYHVWRTDGVGSCRISIHTSEQGIEGLAQKKIIELRLQQNPSDDAEKCGFHIENRGCKLTDLRGPYCLEHIDAPWELKKRFGIDGYQLTQDIRWILQTILHAGIDNPKPDENEEFTQGAIKAIEIMMSYVQKFSFADEEEIQKWKNPSAFFSKRRNTKK